MYLLGKYFCIFIISLFYSQAYAGCVLPVPDGDGPIPSHANVKGHIVSIKNNIVTVRSNMTKNKVSVIVPEDLTLYSALGGSSEAKGTRGLMKKKKAWVWFVGCKRDRKTIPEAAYFQIFSSAPNDQP